MLSPSLTVLFESQLGEAQFKYQNIVESWQKSLGHLPSSIEKANLILIRLNKEYQSTDNHFQIEVIDNLNSNRGRLFTNIFKKEVFEKFKNLYGGPHWIPSLWVDEFFENEVIQIFEFHRRNFLNETNKNTRLNKFYKEEFLDKELMDKAGIIKWLAEAMAYHLSKQGLIAVSNNDDEKEVSNKIPSKYMDIDIAKEKLRSEFARELGLSLHGLKKRIANSGVYPEGRGRFQPKEMLKMLKVFYKK